MLVRYFKACEKYFKSNDIDFVNDINSFNDFIDHDNLVSYLLKPFGKSFTGSYDERLLIEYIYTFLMVNISKREEIDESNVYVPEPRVYTIDHDVKRQVRVTETYSQEIESYITPDEANSSYVDALEILDWFHVYDGDITDTEEEDTGYFDTDFNDIYES